MAIVADFISIYSASRILFIISLSIAILIIIFQIAIIIITKMDKFTKISITDITIKQIDTGKSLLNIKTNEKLRLIEDRSIPTYGIIKISKSEKMSIYILSIANIILLFVSCFFIILFDSFFQCHLYIYCERKIY